MDRTAQWKAVTDLIDPAKAALGASDAAAAKAGANGDAVTRAQHALTAAQAAFANHTGRGSAVDAAQDALDALIAEQPADFQAAVDRRADFNTLYGKLVLAVQGLLQNPGEMERTS